MKTSTKTAPVLSAAMIAHNDNQKQTAWIAIGDVAFNYRSIWVKGAARGSIFGLIRTAKGEAYLIAQTKTTPSFDNGSFVQPERHNVVTINARRFDVYVAVDAAEQSGGVAGLLIDENKRCYRIVRSVDHDNAGYEV